MNQITIIADSHALPPDSKIWGGIIPPQEREALDWLMLCRFLGWTAEVVRIDSSGKLSQLNPCRCLILACDRVHEDTVGQIEALLSTYPVVVLCRAQSPESPLARLCGVFREQFKIGGQSLTWLGPGRKRFWYARKTFNTSALRESETVVHWLKLQEMPVVVARNRGKGVVATLAFHPSEFRDREGIGSSILKHLLIYGSPQPVAWKNLEGVAVLRMDDPGGSQNIFLQDWCYPKMNESQWNELIKVLLARSARLSVGYISGWVDDGDSSRGSLWLQAEQIKTRTAGQVYPSHQIRYEDVSGHAPGTVYDYQQEWRGLQNLRNAGAGDLEPHGYTHLHPSPERWAAAADRYINRNWYHDLRTDVSLESSNAPVAQAIGGLIALGIQPTTLIPPQGIYNNQAVESALQNGLTFVNPYYLALLENGRAMWTTHVVSVPLELPDPKWLDSELPVILFFHDRDIVKNGIEWFTANIDAWQKAGVTQFIDFRQLATTLMSGRS